MAARCRATDPDREALDVVNHVLGGGLSSRLFDEIRERRGLAYSVFSGTASYADAGAWSIYAGTMPEHAATVRPLIDDELDRLVADGITDEELAIAKGFLTGSYEMGLEDSGARMARIGGMLVTTGAVRSGRGATRALGGGDARRRAPGHRPRCTRRRPPLTVALGPDYRR